MFDVRFEQQGECILEGRTVNSASTFTSCNNPLEPGLASNAVRSRVGRCVYTGEAVDFSHLQGAVACTVRLSNGTDLPVAGVWTANRVP